MLLIMSWSQAKKTKKISFFQFFFSLLFSILFDSTECRYDNLFFDFVVCFQSEGFVWITVSITHKHGLLTVNFISLPHAHVSRVKQLSTVWLKNNKLFVQFHEKNWGNSKLLKFVKTLEKVCCCFQLSTSISREKLEKN